MSNIKLNAMSESEFLEKQLALQKEIDKCSKDEVVLKYILQSYKLNILYYRKNSINI